MDLGPVAVPSDEAELISLGTDLVRLGAELKTARSEAELALGKVKTLEAELMPKYARYNQLVAKAVGIAMPQAQPQQSFPPPTSPPAEPLPDWAPPAARLAAMEDPFVGEAPPMPTSVAPAHPPAQNPTTQMKARVKQFLKTRKSDEGISASDIAEVLKIDAGVVREAMREMKTGR